MSFTFLSGTAEGGDAGFPGSSVTTPAIDTRGADLIVVSASFLFGGTNAITDSQGNTWTPLVSIASVTGNQMFYCHNPNTSASHTFTLTTTAYYPALAAAAFSGSASLARDQDADGNAVTGYSVQPGSITPAVDDCLVVSGLAFWFSSSITIDSGFSSPILAGGSVGAAIAYQIQTSATPADPKWSVGSNDYLAVTMSSFLPAAAPPPSKRLAAGLMNGGDLSFAGINTGGRL
jgi:hypothetical protein